MANKKKTETTEEHKKASEALMRADNDRRKQEEALVPYSLNQPYEYETRVQQGQWCLRQIAGMRFILGCILIEVKEKENLQTFVKTLCERFGGMSQADAYHHMLFSKKCIDLKKIREFAEDNWSKTLALLHSTTDEQLKEIEEKGINGKVLDEFDGMSVRDFKKLLTKYKDNTDKIVKAEVRALDAENKHLIKELDRLKAFDPEGKDASWCVEQMKTLDKIADEFDAALRRFVKDPRILNHPEIQAKVEAVQTRMEKRFQLFVQEWDSYVNGEAE